MARPVMFFIAGPSLFFWMIGDDMHKTIKEAFAKQYKNDFKQLKRKVIAYDKFIKSKITYYIRLSKCPGIFKTTVFFIEVLRKEKKQYIKWDIFNKQFHRQTSAVKYINKLTGESNAK